MNLLPPLADAPWQHHGHFIVIFGFVLLVILIRNIFRLRHQRLWHETARIALEKGQPVPPGQGGFRGSCGWNGRRWGWAWYRGLIWIAVGIGLYYCDIGQARNWAPLPFCIGIAMVAGGLIAQMVSKPEANDPTDPAARP